MSEFDALESDADDELSGSHIECHKVAQAIASDDNQTEMVLHRARYAFKILSMDASHLEDGHKELLAKSQAVAANFLDRFIRGDEVKV